MALIATFKSDICGMCFKYMAPTSSSATTVHADTSGDGGAATYTQKNKKLYEHVANNVLIKTTEYILYYN